MKIHVEGRWVALTLLVMVGFVGVVAVAVRFVRLPAPPVGPVAPERKSIGIRNLGGGEAGTRVSDQMLLDPVPLFVPTQWNSSQPEVPELTRRELGAAFAPFAASYNYSEARAGISFPELPIPTDAVTALTYGRTANVFEAWGRLDREERPLPARVALLEVIHAKTGRVVLSAPLTPPSVPDAFRNADWRPVELVATVDATGLIGTPMLTQGSGIDAVDVFLRGYLSKSFHLGERLPAGFYTLRMGP